MTGHRLSVGPATGVADRRSEDAHDGNPRRITSLSEGLSALELAPPAVLALQRTAGNRAVAAMLARQPAPPASARDAGADAGPDAGSDAGTRPTPSPVPGLGPVRTTNVDEAIQQGNKAEALKRLVDFKVADGQIDRALLENATMNFDSGLTTSDGSSSMPAWDYIKGKAEPTKVRIGPGAFSSVAYLYSVVMHEYQHVLWRQSLDNFKRGQQARDQGYKSTSEVEAYAWELGHAAESGIDRQPEKAAEIWGHLNEEFWLLGPDDQARMRPAAQRALQQAQRIVQGTKVTLHPFAR